MGQSDRIKVWEKRALSLKNKRISFFAVLFSHFSVRKSPTVKQKKIMFSHFDYLQKNKNGSGLERPFHF